MAAKYAIIWNPESGSAGKFSGVLQVCENRKDVAILRTSSSEEAEETAARVAEKGAEYVIAAGGDGTVNAVVNGLRDHWNRVTVGVLPTGTGNDFARTLAIPLEPEPALRSLLADVTRSVDLVRLQTPGKVTHFLNIATGGNSHRVSQAVTDDLKKRWGAFCYLRGVVTVLTDLVGFEVTFSCDGGPEETVSAWNVHLANGRMIAGGMEIAPQANPEDGLLDLVVIQDGTPFEAASLAANFAFGEYLTHDRVICRRARHVRLSSSPPLSIVVDGEIVDDHPLEFTVEPQALRVLVGPDYLAEPAESGLFVA